MTPEQIKARCQDVCSQLYAVDQKGIPRGKGIDWGNLWMAIIESLYREAMATGLEMAVVEFTKRQISCQWAAAQPYAESGWQGKEILLGHLAYWCREQASKLKETP